MFKLSFRQASALLSIALTASVVILLLSVMYAISINYTFPSQTDVFFEGIVAVFTSFLAIATWTLAGATSKTIKQQQDEKKIALIQKKLDEFYFPLISVLYGASKEEEEIKIINQLLWTKRYLAGPRTAEKLPKALSWGDGKSGAYPMHDLTRRFLFYNEKEMNEWRIAADTLWEEAMEYTKKYQELSGVAPNEPGVKPEWPFVLEHKE